MIALNRIYVHHVQTSGVYVNAYADNWSYAADEPSAHGEAVSKTLEVTSSLRLQIDWQKTWGWGTKTSHIHALRRAAELARPDLQLQIAVNARELGYILHYRKQQYRGTQKKRHDQARARLKKMSYKGYSVNIMAQLIQQAVLPKAFFGVHIYVPGQHYFDEMRTSICQALCPGGNANPKLVVASMSDRLMDPEVYVILQALRAARRYLQAASIQWKRSFLHLASRRPLEAQRITGPARALRHYVQRLGWSISTEGNLLIDPWTTISLTDADFGLLRQLVERDWADDISRRLTRHHWKNAPALDCIATVGLCRTFTDADRACLVRELAGGFLLQSRKSKFNEDLDESCPLCGLLDTTEHRVLHCETLAEVRDRYPAVVQWLQEMDPIHLHWPFAFQHSDNSMTATMLRAQPKPDLHILPAGNQRARFYTDGSCVFPAHSCIRWAAYGIIQDLRDPTTWSYEDLLNLHFETPNAFQIVAVGLCPGRQTIQRAELEAVLLLLENDTDIDVYTDSAYVILQVQRIRSGAPITDLALCPNYDQLLRLHRVLTTTVHTPGIWKVKAHQKVDRTFTYEELLHATGNQHVDEVAKKAANSLGGPLQTVLRQQAAEYLEHRERLLQHLSFRVDLNKQRTLCIAKQNQPEDVTPPDTDSAFHTLVTWQVRQPHWKADPDFRDDRVLFASFWVLSLLVWCFNGSCCLRGLLNLTRWLGKLRLVLPGRSLQSTSSWWLSSWFPSIHRVPKASQSMKFLSRPMPWLGTKWPWERWLIACGTAFDSWFCYTQRCCYLQSEPVQSDPSTCWMEMATFMASAGDHRCPTKKKPWEQFCNGWEHGINWLIRKSWVDNRLFFLGVNLRELLRWHRCRCTITLETRTAQWGRSAWTTVLPCVDDWGRAERKRASLIERLTWDVQCSLFFLGCWFRVAMFLQKGGLSRQWSRPMGFRSIIPKRTHNHWMARKTPIIQEVKKFIDPGSGSVWSELGSDWRNQKLAATIESNDPLCPISFNRNRSWIEDLPKIPEKNVYTYTWDKTDTKRTLSKDKTENHQGTLRQPLVIEPTIQQTRLRMLRVYHSGENILGPSIRMKTQQTSPNKTHGFAMRLVNKTSKTTTQNNCFRQQNEPGFATKDLSKKYEQLP